MRSESKPNRLIHETSPYLHQHAHNPVDWNPWDDASLARAREEDKPIFLSIGYSACHWCHVMEHESFEDPEIADLLNGLFVNIKVDREERPDLDRIYMTAVQMISGTGGWPMSVFLTPDLNPFFGGTYFPPDDRYGRPGFGRIVKAVAEAFSTRRDEVERTSREVASQIQTMAGLRDADSLLSPSLIDGAVANLASAFDEVNGGFGTAPKFPQSMALQLLLRHYRRTSEIDSIRMARVTLDHMAAGGIYDQIGGGFHRYSTDGRWLAPHFEKMLYDNALLTVAYLEAFQLSREQGDARIARGTLDYLEREMLDSAGGFYSTQDADSEGEEGVFYTWTPEEVREILDEADSELVFRAFDVDEVGNFEGRSILHRVKDDSELGTILGEEAGAVAQRLEAASRKLYESRSRRVWPHRDEKVLVDWNGLAISAFARGSRVLAEPHYLEVAERAATFLFEQFFDTDGNLLHVWKDGAAKIPAFLDDYASLLVACIDLYEASGSMRWLDEARRLQDRLIGDFWDESGGGFFDTSARHDHLIARTKRADDGSIPSGNALASLGMVRFARLTGEKEGSEKTDALLRTFARAMGTIPSGTAAMLLALDFHLAEPQEIAIVGPRGEEATCALRAVIDERFLPHAVLLSGTGDGADRPTGLKGKGLVDSLPTAYVCRGFACKAPVTSPEELRKLLDTP